ncbi:MAG: hypothetical protein Q9227_005508 [Pyrenula ochraceoflavens]
MESTTLPTVQLIGSVPLNSTEEVFTKISKELPGLVRRLPDGEVGERNAYVLWQKDIFPPEIRSSDFVPESSQYDPSFKLKNDDVKPTGYDTAALASYRVFKELRSQGKIPSDMRFQVGLPTPMNSIACYVAPVHATKAEEFYEMRLLEALATIQESIPASDLAIQWDMASEPGHMEHAYGKRDDFKILKPYYSPVKEGIAARCARLAAAVKPEVPMGYHLCYGDFQHAHYIEPHDLGHLVDLTNAVCKAVSAHRAVDWVHMPVPKDRTDEAFFSPLNKLDIADCTTLFLGLVHAHDKLGTRDRIVAANRALEGRSFGVATECGLGRTPVDDLGSIFKISREVTLQN